MASAHETSPVPVARAAAEPSSLMTFVSRRKPFTRNRPAVQMSGHARFQVQLRGAAKLEGSRRVRFRWLPARARPRFRAVAVVPRPSLPPRGASGQARAAGERPGAEPRSQRAWCRVPLPGGGDERREAWSCGLRSRWPCFRERCGIISHAPIRVDPHLTRHRHWLRAPVRCRSDREDWPEVGVPVPASHAGERLYALCGPPGRVPTGGRRSLASAPFGLLAVPFPLSTRAGWGGTAPRPAGTR